MLTQGVTNISGSAECFHPTDLSGCFPRWLSELLKHASEGF